MDILEFKKSISNNHPPDSLHPLLFALWHAAKENWEEAHSIAQDDLTTNGSWVHAYLHRVEGDLSNAGYWYRRAGKEMPPYSVEVEWNRIVETLLAELR